MTDEPRCQTYVLASEVDDYPSKHCNAIIPRLDEGECQRCRRERDDWLHLGGRGLMPCAYLGPLAPACAEGHQQP